MRPANRGRILGRVRERTQTSKVLSVTLPAAALYSVLARICDVGGTIPVNRGLEKKGIHPPLATNTHDQLYFALTRSHVTASAHIQKVHPSLPHSYITMP